LGGSALINVCTSEDGSPELLQLFIELHKGQITQAINIQRRGRTLKWRNIFRIARFMYQNSLTKSELFKEFAHMTGSTALHYAVKLGDADIVDLLLRHGADPTIKNDLGKTSVDYCDAFPELRGALKRVIQQRRGTKLRITTLQRRDSTATDMKFPMYLVPLDQLHRLYGGKDPRHERIEAHQNLKQRGELVRWEDLPIDAHIIFLSHEWVGWNHPDPHGIQLKTFLRVMTRLRSGKISQVEMNIIHQLFYKTNTITSSKEWKEILSTAYVWIDWASMPQPSACPASESKEKKKILEANLGKAVKSIPAYVYNILSYIYIPANTNLHLKTHYIYT